MKVLIIDTYGLGVDLALRAQWAGHQVKHYLAPSKRPNVGKGLTTRVRDWREHMRWADLIVTTASAKYAWEMEDYYEKGYPIFGANEDSAKWELDRCVGIEVLEAHGIECLPYRRFDSYSDAIEYVKKTNGTYVCKPIGDADRMLSYVSKGPDDMKSQLARAEKLSPKCQPFILQEKMGGTEFSISGWYGKNGWVGPWEEAFEHKKLMPGDVGVNTGEMGTAMKYVDNSKLADKLLKPLASALHALRFRGNININCKIDDKGQPWALEFGMRLGWPAFFMHTHLHKGDPVQWMRDLLDGKDSLHVDYNHCIAVNVVGPSFPHCHLTHEEVEGYPLFGINQSNLKHMHLAEVMADEAEVYEDGKWSTRHLFHTAGDWYLCVVDTGSSVRTAADRAYRHVESLKIPNSPTWRNDVGYKLEKDLKKLKSMGYALDWEYGDAAS